MTRAIVLDAGPLGLATNPKRSSLNLACAEWVQTRILARDRVVIPEIADYEVRRELVRANKTAGLARLDGLIQTVTYLPITTEAMRLAAVLWAQCRQQGMPAADDKELDADVILAAQARLLSADSVVIATTNVGHLGRLAHAQVWQSIL